MNPARPSEVHQLADRFGMDVIDLEHVSIDRDLLERFPATDLFREIVLPVRREGQTVTVAVADPLNLEALNALSARTGFVLDSVLATTAQIEQRLKQLLGVGGGTVSDLMAGTAEAEESAEDLELADQSEASSVVRLVNEVLQEAVAQRASDVHIEPQEHELEVRYRVDGILRVQPMPPRINHFRAAIVSRLKIMARLNIAEKRLPQDGRMTIDVDGREISIRLSVIPMLYGEGVVMRLLDKSRVNVSLDAVEFPPQLQQQWHSLIHRSHGMILVTGPTGSGKTTTLYSSLAERRSPTTKIITVEDPIEYGLPGISQIQVQNQIGLSFAAGLRSILRHDPDVVLIGEIRDAETATSAIQASLTGHLVLSTLHTNDAAGAFTRLIDMGIEPYLVASTVEAVLAQRLVRRLCPHCRESIVPAAEEIPADMPWEPNTPLAAATGCRDCHHSGYAGRIALFELLHSDNTIRQLCTQQRPVSELREHAIRQGMESLRSSGWQRVLDGQTTVDEVLRVCATGEE